MCDAIAWIYVARSSVGPRVRVWCARGGVWEGRRAYIAAATVNQFATLPSDSRRIYCSAASVPTRVPHIHYTNTARVTTPRGRAPRGLSDRRRRPGGSSVRSRRFMLSRSVAIESYVNGKIISRENKNGNFNLSSPPQSPNMSKMCVWISISIGNAGP